MNNIIDAERKLYADKKYTKRKCKNCKSYNGNGGCVCGIPADWEPDEVSEDNICDSHKFPNEKYKHNVMEMNSSCSIRVCADSLVLIDCIFIVDRKDREKALLVLNKAYDEFWTEDVNYFCYGEFFEGRLTESGIKFTSFYTGLYRRQ